MNDNDDGPLPPRLIDVEFSILSLDPLVGIVTLETEQGPIEIAVNRTVSGLLAAGLVEMLSLTPEDMDDTIN